MAERKSKKNIKPTTPDVSSIMELFSGTTPQTGEPYIIDQLPDTYLSPQSERPKGAPRNPLEPRKPEDPVELQEEGFSFRPTDMLNPLSKNYYFKDANRLGSKAKNIEDLARLQLPQPGSQITENQAYLLASLGLLNDSYVMPKGIREAYDKQQVYDVMHDNPLAWIIGGKDADGKEIPGAFDFIEAVSEGAVPPALDFLEPYFKGMSGRSDFKSPTVNKETTKLYKQYADGEISFQDLINKSQENFRERDLSEQVVLGLLDPTNFATGGAKGVGVAGSSLFAKAGLPILAGIMKNADEATKLGRKVKFVDEMGSVMGTAAQSTVSQNPYKFVSPVLRKIEDMMFNIKIGRMKPGFAAFRNDEYKAFTRQDGEAIFNEITDLGAKGLLNRYAPFGTLVRQAAEKFADVKGYPMPNFMKTNYLIQLYAGMDSAAGHVINKTHKSALAAVDNVESHLDYVNSYLLLRHMKDVLNMKDARTFTQTLTPQVRKLLIGTEDAPAINPDLTNKETIDEALRMLEEEVGAGLFKKIKDSAKIYVDAIDNQFQRAIDDGIVDPKIAGELRTNYPWYNPIRYVDEMKEIDDGNVPLFSRKMIDKVRGKLKNMPTDEKGNPLPVEGVSGYGPGYAGVKERVLASLSEEGSEMARMMPTEAFDIYMASMEKLLAFNKIKKSLADLALWVPGISVNVTKGKKVATEVIDGVNRDIFRPNLDLKTNEISYLANGGKQYTISFSKKALRGGKYVLEPDDTYVKLLERLRQGGNTNAAIRMFNYMLKDNFLAKFTRQTWIQKNPATLYFLTAADSMTQVIMRGVPFGIRSAVHELIARRTGQLEELGIGTAMLGGIPRAEQLKQEATIINGIRTAYRGIFKDDKVWDELMAAGGNPTGFYGKNYQKKFQDIVKNAGNPKSRLDINMKIMGKNFNPKDILSTWDKLAHASEMGPRTAVYIKSRTDGIDPMMAAIAARNSAGDFQQLGIATEFLNTAFWYLSPAIQGFMAPIRAARNNPEVAMRGLRAFAEVQTLLYLHNRVYEEYFDVPRDEKNGLLIMIPSNEINPLTGKKEPHYFRLPTYIPLGVPFTYLLEQIDEKVSEFFLKEYPELQVKAGKTVDPFSDVLKHTLNSVNPLQAVTGRITNTDELTMDELGKAYFMPTIGKLPTDLANNRNSFTGMPIVPVEYARKPVEMQYDETTSEVAKTTGSWFGMSPFKIDHILSSYGDFGNVILWAGNHIDNLINGKDPVVEALVAEIEEQLEFVPAEQQPLIVRDFLTDIKDVKIRKEVTFELQDRKKRGEKAPVIGTWKSRQFKNRGGAIYQAGLQEADKGIFGFYLDKDTKEWKRAEVSTAQTREAAKQLAIFWEGTILPMQHANDLAFQRKEISAAQWENERQDINNIKAMLSMMVDNGFNLQLAAQGLGTTNEETGERIPEEFGSVYEWWLKTVNTVANKIDDRRARGATLAAVLYNLPRYTLEGVEITSNMPAAQIDWYRLQKDQEAFKESIGIDNVNALEEWQTVNRSDTEIKYRKDMETMSKYYDVIDVVIDEMMKIIPKDKEGKDLRYHYQVYQSKSGQDRLKYSQTYLLDIDGTPVYILDEIDKRVRKDREMVANAQFDANFIMRYKDIFFNQPGDFIKDKNGTPVLQKSALDRYVRECYAIEQARLYWGRIDKPKTAAGQQEFIEDLKENPLEFNILKPRQY